MQIPLRLHLKNVKNKKPIEKLIQEKVEKLDKICQRLISCRIVVECQADGQKKTNHDNIHIEIKFPPHHDILVKREAAHEEDLLTLVREAFLIVRRQVQDIINKHQFHKAVKAAELVV